MNVVSVFRNAVTGQKANEPQRLFFWISSGIVSRRWNWYCSHSVFKRLSWCKYACFTKYVCVHGMRQRLFWIEKFGYTDAQFFATAHEWNAVPQCGELYISNLNMSAIHIKYAYMSTCPHILNLSIFKHVTGKLSKTCTCMNISRHAITSSIWTSWKMWRAIPLKCEHVCNTS